jgi:lipopolysaccharide transport system permease protein
MPIHFKKMLFYCGQFAILVGAMLVAIQLRYDLRYGKALGAKYDAQPLWLYIILVLAVTLSALIDQFPLPLKQGFKLNLQFASLLLTTGLAAGGILILLPTISQLQMIYFIVISGLLGLLTIVLPQRLRLVENLGTLTHNLETLWEYRILMGIWLRYNIQSRYSQSILGILWILLIPLSTGLVLALALTVFLRIQLDVPFIVFFFSAFTVYNIFGQGVNNSTHAITGSMGILNQVNFPREILVLVAMGEALVDTFLMFIAMLVINAMHGVYPTPSYVLLIPIILIMISFTLGVMLLVSFLSVMVRDIPQLVGILLQLFFYLTPLIYPAENIPENYQVVILINPLAPLIQATRDIIAYHQTPDWLSLTYPLVVSVVVLLMGYTLFKVNEGKLVDMV